MEQIELTKEEVDTYFAQLKEAWADRRKATEDNNVLSRTAAEAKINIAQKALREAGIKVGGKEIEISDFTKPFTPKFGGGGSGTTKKFWGKKELTVEEMNKKSDDFLTAVLPVAIKHAKQIVPSGTDGKETLIVAQALVKAVGVYLSR